MDYRRGLFRFWLVVTLVALIVAPIWLLAAGLRDAGHACFEITELRLNVIPETTPSSALSLAALPSTAGASALSSRGGDGKEPGPPKPAP